MENDNQPERDGSVQPATGSARNKLVMLLVAVAVLLGLALFFYLSGSEREPEPVSLAPPAPREVSPPPSPAPAPTPAPTPAPAPEVALPTPAPKPLPPLSESDTVLREEIGALRDGQSLVALLVPDELVRKFVRAVHVMATDGTVVHEYRPIRSPSGQLQVEQAPEIAAEEINQLYLLQEANYRRYDPYVSLLARMDPDALVALYRRFLPLLDQAYAEQGVGDKRFTAVLIGAIDHVLAAPVEEGTLVLVRPRVFYQYEDPSLERLPGAHKLMLRIGPGNAQSVKTSLRRLRTRLAAL